MTAKWWTRNAIGLDFESDSKDPEDARIITANTTIIQPEREPQVGSWLVVAERDIPAEATEVHGITTEHARENGKPRGEAVADIVEWLGNASATCPVVIHNAPYDLTLLDRELRRLGLGSLGIEPGSDRCAIRLDGRTAAVFPVIDTLVLDKQVDRYRKGPPEGGRNRLSVAAQFYGVPMTEGSAHNADADVMACLRMAWRIAQRSALTPSQLQHIYADRNRPWEVAESFAALGALSLSELHHAQTVWCAEQAVGLRKYFAQHPEKGVDPADVSGAWPFRPFV